MKIYKASNELIDILFKHGFTEVTGKYHPEHVAYMEKMGEYNPSSVKRWFKKGRILFWFDYINLHLSYNSATIIFASMNINENELKSIIFFTYLSGNNRHFFSKKDIKPFEIHEYVSSKSSLLLKKQKLVDDFNNFEL